MKRVYVALALLAVITVSCIVSIRMEKKTLTHMIRMTEELERYCRAGDTENARATAVRLEDEFTDKSRSFALFLHHNVLVEIEESLVVLPDYLQYGETEHALSEIIRSRLYLQKQLEAELPTWDNIF